LYHLQQAAEKGTNAFCLALGITNPHKLKSHHRSPVFLLQALNSAYLLNFERLLSNIGGKNYRRVLKQVNKTINGEPEYLARLPFGSTRGSLGIRALFDTLDNLGAGSSTIEDVERKVKEAVAECLPEFQDIALNYSTEGMGLLGVNCYLLGVLTFPHESYTRYPGGNLEPQDYNNELGIVQAVPQLLNRVPTMIEEIGQFVERQQLTAAPTPPNTRS
jgi:hypothetical protein